MKKILSLLLALVMAATIMTGCGAQSSGGAAGENAAQTADKKEKVVVACWGNQMLEGYNQYLCEMFP